jgi:hypothetical protein
LSAVSDGHLHALIHAPSVSLMEGSRRPAVRPGRVSRELRQRLVGKVRMISSKGQRRLAAESFRRWLGRNPWFYRTSRPDPSYEMARLMHGFSDITEYDRHKLRHRDRHSEIRYLDNQKGMFLTILRSEIDALSTILPNCSNSHRSPGPLV